MPKTEIRYEFEGRGVEVICDDAERVQTIFLRRGEGESLSELPFQYRLDRDEIEMITLMRRGRHKMSNHPNENEIGAFWGWFSTIASELATDLENDDLLQALDERVSRLGVAWELGPGTTRPSALAITPDGDRDLLPLTRHIVALAPQIPGWELLAARPPRNPSLTFSLRQTGSGSEVEIDATRWRYVLFRFQDGTFDAVIHQQGTEIDDSSRHAAAALCLDGILGEAKRLELIRDIEPVAALGSEIENRANPISALADHLRSLTRS